MRIRAGNGRYLTAEAGGGLNGDPTRTDPTTGALLPVRYDVLVADRTDADLEAFGDAWQQFERVEHADGTIALKIGDWYVTAERGGGGPVSTDRTVDEAWQRFRPVTLGDGRTVLVCADGQHVLAVANQQLAIVDCTRTLAGVAWTLEGGGTDPIGPITVPPRAPLPPFHTDSSDPDTGAPLHVTTALPTAPPPRGTPRWWRADAWSVTLPGLPWVEGGATGPAQDRCLSWFLNRWDPHWQDEILRAHLARGYDRYTLSWPDSRQSGQTIADYVAMSRYVRDAGLWPHHMLASKTDNVRNPDPRELDPLLDALLEADLIPFASAWEMNAFMDPGDAAIVPWLQYVGGRLTPHGTLVYAHFFPHYASWQADGAAPATFWEPLVGVVQGLLYQCDPAWDAGMIQARLNDVLVRLIADGVWGLSHTFDCVAWETKALEQFYDHCDEDEGNLFGYESLCSEGPMTVQGFGGGARAPSGAAL